MTESREVDSRYTPQDQLHPLGPGTPQTRYPQDQVHPLDWVHPLGPGAPPTSSACWEIWATSRQYASYWNAFLFTSVCHSVHRSHDQGGLHPGRGLPPGEGVCLQGGLHPEGVCSQRSEFTELVFRHFLDIFGQQFSGGHPP